MELWASQWPKVEETRFSEVGVGQNPGAPHKGSMVRLIL